MQLAPDKTASLDVAQGDGSWLVTPTVVLQFSATFASSSSYRKAKVLTVWIQQSLIPLLCQCTFSQIYQLTKELTKLCTGSVKNGKLLSFSGCSSGKILKGKRVKGTFPVPHFMTAGLLSTSLYMLNGMKCKLMETAAESNQT